MSLRIIESSHYWTFCEGCQSVTVANLIWALGVALHDALRLATMANRVGHRPMPRPRTCQAPIAHHTLLTPIVQCTRTISIQSDYDIWCDCKQTPWPWPWPMISHGLGWVGGDLGTGSQWPALGRNTACWRWKWKNNIRFQDEIIDPVLA